MAIRTYSPRPLRLVSKRQMSLQGSERYTTTSKRSTMHKKNTSAYDRGYEQGQRDMLIAMLVMAMLILAFGICGGIERGTIGW